MSVNQNPLWKPSPTQGEHTDTAGSPPRDPLTSYNQWHHHLNCVFHMFLSFFQVYNLQSDTYDSFNQHYGRSLVKDTVKDGMYIQLCIINNNKKRIRSFKVGYYEMFLDNKVDHSFFQSFIWRNTSN